MNIGMYVYLRSVMITMMFLISCFGGGKNRLGFRSEGKKGDLGVYGMRKWVWWGNCRKEWKEE